MAINKREINFQHKADYLVEKEAGNILNQSVVYIDDSHEIVTHDTVFDGNIPDWEAQEGEAGYIKNKPNLEELGGNNDVSEEIEELYRIVKCGYNFEKIYKIEDGNGATELTLFPFDSDEVTDEQFEELLSSFQEWEFSKDVEYDDCIIHIDIRYSQPFNSNRIMIIKPVVSEEGYEYFETLFIYDTNDGREGRYLNPSIIKFYYNPAIGIA